MRIFRVPINADSYMTNQPPPPPPPGNDCEGNSKREMAVPWVVGVMIGVVVGGAVMYCTMRRGVIGGGSSGGNNIQNTRSDLGTSYAPMS